MPYGKPNSLSAQNALNIASYINAPDKPRPDGLADDFYCFDDPDALADEFSSLPGVPCAEPHDNETFAVFDLTMADYPEYDIAEISESSCIEHFETYVGRDYETSALDVVTMYPTPEGWAQNDREVVCALYDMSGAKLVGSVKGRGI